MKNDNDIKAELKIESGGYSSSNTLDRHSVKMIAAGVVTELVKTFHDPADISIAQMQSLIDTATKALLVELDRFDVKIKDEVL
jgi:hypothetical protein